MTSYHNQVSNKLSDNLVILWADDSDSIENYGEHHWVLEDYTCDIRDVFCAIRDRYRDHPWDLSQELQEVDAYWADDPDTGKKLFLWDLFFMDLNPRDIVGSAGWWDNYSFVAWFCDQFHDQMSLFGAIATHDGGITLSPEHGRYLGYFEPDQIR